MKILQIIPAEGWHVSFTPKGKLGDPTHTFRVVAWALDVDGTVHGLVPKGQGFGLEYAEASEGPTYYFKAKP